MVLALEIDQTELVKLRDQIIDNIDEILEKANENDLFISTDDLFKDSLLEFADIVPKKGIIVRKG